MWPDVQIKLWHPVIHLKPYRFRADVCIMQHLNTGISSIPQKKKKSFSFQQFVCSIQCTTLALFSHKWNVTPIVSGLEFNPYNSVSVPRISMSVDVFMEALCVNVCECVARVWACIIWNWQWYVTDSMASGFGALLQRMTKKKNRHLIWMAIFSGPIMLQTISLHFTNHLFFVFLSKFGWADI